MNSSADKLAGKYLVWSHEQRVEFEPQVEGEGFRREQQLRRVQVDMKRQAGRRATREDFKSRPMSLNELSSWRRSSRGAALLLLVVIVVCRPKCDALPFTASQQQQLPSQAQERCKLGAPLQWQQHLDASSKAYLAPAVAVATLERFVLSPMQLAAGSGSLRQPKGATGGELPLQTQSLAQHAQSVNNVGVLIEAVFLVRTILKRPPTGWIELAPGRELGLVYKVSASLSTNSDIIALANSMEQSAANQSNRASYNSRPSMTPAAVSHCALELTERELSKRGGDLFKVGRSFILFLEPKSAPNQRGPQQVAANPMGGRVWWWSPFASHEPVSNQTSRLVNRVLCKNCVRQPAVRLMNATQAGQQFAPTQDSGRRRLKLDCRVSGNPTPWVEWFKNGKLLRNKPGRTQIRTSPWRGRPNERLSRLELEFAANRNESNVFECRAMNVAAREPALGSYTLLVSSGQFSLYSMQQLAGLRQERQRANRTRDQSNSNSATKTNSSKPADSQLSGAAAIRPEGARTRPGNLQGGSEPAANSTSTSLAPPAAATKQQQQEAGDQRPPEEPRPADVEVGGGGGPSAQQQNQQQEKQSNSTSNSSPVVGRPCLERDFCLNRGTCVHLDHINENLCNCAQGYNGRRCEFKTTSRFDLSSSMRHL